MTSKQRRGLLHNAAGSKPRAGVRNRLNRGGRAAWGDGGLSKDGCVCEREQECNQENSAIQLLLISGVHGISFLV